ncbi:MAG TPA: lytic transglycosylase domain-containing protein, partial [Marmoricola sp.]|nr:lytic transglycosylase domain-containing protein [Marmoricola sp.]
MTARPLSQRAKFATAIPVAVVSGLWTASLVLSSAGSAANAKDQTHEPLPDGSKIPTQVISTPASLPIMGTIGAAVPADKADQVITDAIRSGIPAPALAAYQRSAQVVSQADKRCNLPWALLAAMGRAESDHGQLGNSNIDDHGVSKPGAFGPTLNGTEGTKLVNDTDGGKLDRDSVYDRGVGAMQFVPATWKLVKVDGDSDGKADPQNVNDAAMGAAMYLCSGGQNLATRSAKEASLFRFHPDRNYVNLVLRLMEAYQTGDFTAMPSGTWGGMTFTPDEFRKAAEKHFEEKRAAAAKRKLNTPPPPQSTPNLNTPEPNPQQPNPSPDLPKPSPQDPTPSSAPQQDQPEQTPPEQQPAPQQPEPPQPEPSQPEPPQPSPEPEPSAAPEPTPEPSTAPDPSPEPP